MSYELKDRMQDAAKSMYKQPTIPEEVEGYIEPVDLEKLIGDLTLKKLNDIFQSIMKRQNEKVDPIRSKFGKIEKDEINLEEKTSYIEQYIAMNDKMSFRDLLEKQNSKMEVIVTFLALLELLRQHRIVVYQNAAFHEITILPSYETPEGLPLETPDEW
jgi:segregation and condensation protein A